MELGDKLIQNGVNCTAMSSFRENMTWNESNLAFTTAVLPHAVKSYMRFTCGPEEGLCEEFLYKSAPKTPYHQSQH